MLHVKLMVVMSLFVFVLFVCLFVLVFLSGNHPCLTDYLFVIVFGRFNLRVIFTN